MAKKASKDDETAEDGAVAPKPGKKKLVMIGGAVALVAVLGGGGWFFFMKKKPAEEVTAEQMIAGLEQMAVRAHGAGLKIIGATLTPFGNETFMANAWNPARERHRVAVNDWMRTSGAFDAVADFDMALRDPEIPTQMRAADDCGDGLHPSDSGYCKMGDVIDLAWFD